MFEIQTRREEERKPILYKNELYHYYDEGLTRKVFVNEDQTKVIKLLIKEDCLNYNLEEFEIFDNAGDKSQYAETKISEDKLIVEQEFVEPIKFSKRTDLSISDILFAQSCRNEVGFNKKGKLVCFDLSEFKKY